MKHPPVRKISETTDLVLKCEVDNTAVLPEIDRIRAVTEEELVKRARCLLAIPNDLSELHNLLEVALSLAVHPELVIEVNTSLSELRRINFGEIA